MPRLRLFCVLSLLAAAVSVSGCGAIVSTSALSDATHALDEARTIGAERTAVYEVVSAEAYLDKAREEWGRSDYQMAIDYARRARVFAEQAVQRVQREAAPYGAAEPRPSGRSYAPQR